MRISRYTQRNARRQAIKTILGGAAALALWMMKSPAFAQAQATQSVNAALAAYNGPDRQQRLVDGAKKEGSALTIYTSAPPDDSAIFVAAFEKKYGIKVKLWRSASENVLQRAIAEGKAGRFDADILDTNGPELELLHRENMLQAVASPYLADLIKPAVLPHGEWVGTRLNIFTQAYNTKLIKKEDIPKSYEDFLDPKWKGKLAIEAGDLDWLASVTAEMGEAKGLQLFRNIVAANGISIRKGHTLLCNLVASGEVPLALTVYNYKAEQLKHKGAPIDWFSIPPAFARPNGIAMLRRAPHPHAAVLYYDYMLSDAQQVMLKLDYVPTSTKVDTALNAMPLKFVDPLVVLDQNDKWQKLYDEIFINKRS
jgi:iron(III) transport system substrate-binding protein